MRGERGSRAKIEAPEKIDSRAKISGWPLAWLPPALWAAFIFVVSSLPGDGLPPLPGVQLDKLIHAAVYAVLGALCLRALSRTTRLSPLAAAAVAATLASLYGASDEVHQMFTPGRSADLIDFAADALGAVAGVWIMTVAARRRRRADPARPGPSPSTAGGRRGDG